MNKNNDENKEIDRYNNMLIAGLVSLAFFGVGIYGYVFKSFREGAVYVTLSNEQALGVLIFCCAAAIGVLFYGWWLSK